jgi:hypothetical protein
VIGDNQGLVFLFSFHVEGFERREAVKNLENTLQAQLYGGYFGVTPLKEIGTKVSEIVCVQRLHDGGAIFISKDGRIHGVNKDRQMVLRGHISLDYKVYRLGNVKPIQFFPAPFSSLNLKLN